MVSLVAMDGSASRSGAGIAVELRNGGVKVADSVVQELVVALMVGPRTTATDKLFSLFPDLLVVKEDRTGTAVLLSMMCFVSVNVKVFSLVCV